MNKKQIVGIVVIIAFFLVSIAVLVMTFQPKGNKQGGTVEDSYFVQQRIKNLEKSQ